MKNIIQKTDEKTLKYILISTLIFMAIAHGYCYTNLNFSHDSMRTFYWMTADTLEIGRFILPILLILRGNYYPPLLIGALTYIFLSLVIYLLVNFFKIKTKVGQVLVSGIFATASTLTLLNATYIDFSDMYVFGLFLMTIAVYIWKNYKKGYLFAIIPVFISLGIYQSYICFFIGIVMLLSIRDIIENTNYKEILLNGTKAIITIFASLILYAISLKIIPMLTGVNLSNNYNSVGGLGEFFISGGFINILRLILKTYYDTLLYIIKPSTYYNQLISIFNIIFILMAFVFTLLFLKSKKISKQNKILLVILLILLPFGINLAYFLGRGVSHQLMIYPLFLLYLPLIYIIENGVLQKYLKSKKIINCFKNFKNISLTLLIISSIIYSNQCYLKKNLEFDATLTTMNRIVYAIEQTEGYEVGKTKVAIIGSLNDSIISTKRKELDYISVGLGSNFSVTHYDTYRLYFANYLSYPINLVSEYEIKEFKKMDEVKEMNQFPTNGYIKFIDDILVIKLSAIEE